MRHVLFSYTQTSIADGRPSTSSVFMPAKLSASQKQLLSLYRRGLRCIRTKPEHSHANFHLYLRQLFRAPFGQPHPIARRDFGTLDYFQRMIARTMDSYFANTSVRRIALPNPLPIPLERLGSGRTLRNGQHVDGQRHA